jgi:dolichyl-phosphooligosaccharide-protein glycotransferase
MPSVVVRLAVLGVAVVALVMRSTDLPQVFAADGGAYLDIHDSAYHARVALYDFVNFPSALHFDPWMAYPDGALVPNPFLFDWTVAGTARLFGSSRRHFEWTAAWASPVLATLAALVVFAMGRLLGGSGLGLAAAAIFAVSPPSLHHSQVGDLDHHAAVAFLGALLLWGSLELARTPAQRGRTFVAAALVGLAQVAMVLTWSGSLLYLGLCEGALLLTAIFENRRELLWAQSAGALGAAALCALYIASVPNSIGAPFTTTTLSWFHVVALSLAGTTAALLAVALSRSRKRSAAQRLVTGLAIGAALSVAALAVPAVREGLLPSFSFLASADEWAAANPEQQHLYGSGGALANFGLMAYLLPLTVLGPVLLMREEARRGLGICLLCWTTVLGALAVLQIRFLNDFVPAASLVLALLARHGSEWLGAHVQVPAARLAVGAAIGVLLLPGWQDADIFKRALAQALGEKPVETERMDARRTLTVFAQMLREATPETADLDQPGAKPSYGVLAPASFGHTLHYYARRATPANNFGPYLDLEKFRAARRFYNAHDEAEAIAIAEQLRTRYVMSYARELADRELFIFSLHAHDRPVGGGYAERLRLIVEGPANGMVFAEYFPSGQMPEETIPYKLFEVVRGAVLEARGGPGTELRAEIEVASNLGRRFVVSASTHADAAGVARLRVPYATALISNLPTKAIGPYRVRFGAAEAEAHVSEADVNEGRVVRVGPFEPGA